LIFIQTFESQYVKYATTGYLQVLLFTLNKKIPDLLFALNKSMYFLLSILNKSYICHSINQRMDSLFIKQERLLAQTSTHIIRELMNQIHWDNPLIAIRGSRGVGKTTLMLQYIKLNFQPGSREVLYCTLDSIYFSNHTLSELIERFYLQGGKQLFLDEVHKYPTWSKEIKEAYDLYPSLRIVFSGSSLLNILNADADLSRRCLPYNMYGLSFREFLMFYKQIDIPVYSLQTILEDPGNICREINEKCRPVQMFNEYLHEGYYPFFTGNREDYYINIENVVNLIIEQELPLLCGVDPAYTRKLKALMGILATSVPYELDITKLAGMIGLSRNSVINYLQNLDKAELLKLLYSDLLSVKKMQKPDKIYLQNPNLLYAIASAPVQIGTARETFVVNQLSVNHNVEYGKTKGDFIVDHTYTFEIGGADKTFKQIADLPDSFILADNMEFATGKKLPLWIVGLTY